MNGRHDRESPETLGLRRSLVQLRRSEGLTPARLATAEADIAGPFLELGATRHHMSAYGIRSPTDAAHQVVLHCVHDVIENDTYRLVADSILGLGSLAVTLSENGVDDTVIRTLYARKLGMRREALRKNWRRLHVALDATPPDPPSDRTLRGSIEGEVFHELAHLLTRLEIPGRRLHRAAKAMDGAGKSENSAPRGRVIVVGGAVMDVIFHTSEFPRRETSIEATGFDLLPGGKGLTQAVAAARLDLDVSLIATVADDHFGQQIVDYLAGKGVDVSLITRVRDATTPFTGIIELDHGDSMAVNWRNAREVYVKSKDVSRNRQLLTTCDVVLMTFEIPRESLQHALGIVHTARGDRPPVIVTPGQPYLDGKLTELALSQIDYMVANAWELAQYCPPDVESTDPDRVARHLHAAGVRTLCMLDNKGCTAYSEGRDVIHRQAASSFYKETQAARDAFCAALAAWLVDNREHGFNEHAVDWATAAMSCATSDFLLSDSMPDRQRIEQLLG